MLMTEGRQTRPGRETGKRIAWFLLGLAGAFRLGRWLSRRCLVVLTYHHVLPNRQPRLPSRPSNSLFAREFERQVAYIIRRYHVVSGEEVRAFLTGRTRLPPNSVLITFDDGYQDNYTEAFPILRRFGASAMFFLPTDLIGKSGRRLWFDRLDALLAGASRADLATFLASQDLPPQARTPVRFRQWLKGLSPRRRETMLGTVERDLGQGGTAPENGRTSIPMTWDQVREMVANGMTIGSHTASHQILSRASPEEVWQELITSRQRIEEEIGGPCWSFSYPNGEVEDFGASEKAAVRSAGYSCAFTQIPGFITPRSDYYALPRMSVPDSEDVRVFLSRLTGIHAWLSGSSRRVRG